MKLVNKNDQRAKISKIILLEAFENLLKKKPLNKISVTELCKEANVNRGTFYNHYLDIVDFYNDIKKDFFNIINESVNETTTNNINKEKEIIFNILNNIYENKVISSIIVELTLNQDNLKELLNIGENKFIEYCKIYYPKKTILEYKYFYTYSSIGTLSLISSWIKHNYDINVDSLANELIKLNKATLNYLN